MNILTRLWNLLDKRRISAMWPCETGYVVRWAVTIVNGQPYINKAHEVVSRPSGTSAVKVKKTFDFDCPYVVYRTTAFNHGNSVGTSDGHLWPAVEHMVYESYAKCRIVD